MNMLLEITINDGLGFENGFVSPAHYTCMIYIIAPQGWIQDNEISYERQEEILQKMYGENWRMGNGDGSFFVVSEFSWKIRNAADSPWKDFDNNQNFRCWFWKVDENILKDALVNEMKQ